MSPTLSKLISMLHRRALPELRLAALKSRLAERDKESLCQAIVDFAQSSLNQKDVAEAIQSLDIASEVLPDTGSIWALKGKAWHLMGETSGEPVDLKQALACFQKALDLRALSAPGWRDYGETLGALGRFTASRSLLRQSLAACRKAVQLSKEHLDKGELYLSLARAANALCKLEYDEGLLEESIEAFEQAAKRDPLNSRLHIAWSRCYWLLAKHGKKYAAPEALKLARTALELEPDSSWAQFHLVNMLLTDLHPETKKLQSIREAEQIIKQALKNTQEDAFTLAAQGLVLFHRAAYFSDTDTLQQAVHLFSRAAELQPNRPMCWRLLGRSLFQLSLQTVSASVAEKCVQAFQQATQLRPWSSSDAGEWATALIQLAHIRESHEDLERSLVILDHWQQLCVGKKAETASCLYHKGYVHDLLGDVYGDVTHIEKAIQLLGESLQMTPERPTTRQALAEAFVHLGEVVSDVDALATAIKLFESCRPDLDEDADLYQEWGFALLQLARIIHTSGDPKIDFLLHEAEEKLKNAALLGSSHAYYLLGCCYAMAQQPQMALQSLRLAKKHEALPDAETILDTSELQVLHDLPEFRKILEE